MAGAEKNFSSKRCAWVDEKDALMVAYHDEEWGVPLFNDKKIFEFLILESFQAGLSWRTVLHKRRNFAGAFANFDPVKVAKFGRRDISKLTKDAGIIRNLAKIRAAVNNAQQFLAVKKEFGSFSKYMWSWVKDKPLQHRLVKLADYPTVIPEALAWAKDLKRRSFQFLGPTTLYAHMQAVGMVNDHMTTCWRQK